MRWVWVVIPLILIGIIGVQESFARGDSPRYSIILTDIEGNVSMPPSLGEKNFLRFDSLGFGNQGMPLEATISIVCGLNETVLYDETKLLTITSSEVIIDSFTSKFSGDYTITMMAEGIQPISIMFSVQGSIEDRCDSEFIKNLPPKKQIDSGISTNEVTCKEMLQLIFKSTDGSPACVKPETAEKLIQRGWAIVQNDNRGGSFSPTSYFDSHLTMSHPPKLNETAEITFQITHDDPRDVPDYYSVIRLPEGFELVSGNLEQTMFWKSGDILELNATIRAIQSGNWTIDAVGEGGTIDTIYIVVSEDEAFFHDGPFPLKPRPPYVIKGPIEELVDSIEIINGCKDVGGEWSSVHNECESGQITEEFENYCSDFSGEFDSCAPNCYNDICTSQCLALCEFD